ncbi:TrmH family RNA methyltransferase [Salinimicrobium soli]|uniref:TrmH family RNA methyltransferase n=1 Tax=Salinimicrobium soli TaxID=1254399 RepID=UPI003AAE8890
MQLTHSDTEFSEKKFPIIILLDGIASPANLGSLFRLADAFNVEKIISCGSVGIDLGSNRLRRTARATIEKVALEEREEILEVLTDLQKRNYFTLALEITSDSIPVESLDYSQFKKVALVLGNERSGINEEVLKKVQQKIHITMFGRNSSMNVAQAAGISLFEITKTLPPVL